MKNPQMEKVRRGQKSGEKRNGEDEKNRDAINAQQRPKEVNDKKNGLQAQILLWCFENRTILSKTLPYPWFVSSIDHSSRLFSWRQQE